MTDRMTDTESKEAQRGSEIVTFKQEENGGLLLTSIVRHPNHSLEEILTANDIVFFKEEKIGAVQLYGQSRYPCRFPVREFHTLVLGKEDYFPVLLLNPNSGNASPGITIVAASMRRYSQITEVKSGLPPQFDFSTFTPDNIAWAMLNLYNEKLASILKTPDPEMAKEYAKQPQRAMQIIYKGLHLQKRRIYEEAKQTFQQAIDENPDFYLPYSCIGKVLLDQERLEDAFDYFNKAWNRCHLFEERRRIFLLRIHALYAMEDFDSVETDLNEIVRVSEQDTQHDQLYIESMFLLSMIEARRNQKDAATERLRRILSIAPSYRHAEEALAYLDGGLQER